MQADGGGGGGNKTCMSRLQPRKIITVIWQTCRGEQTRPGLPTVHRHTACIPMNGKGETAKGGKRLSGREGLCERWHNVSSFDGNRCHRLF